jgi:hypothetical protein
MVSHEIARDPVSESNDRGGAAGIAWVPPVAVAPGKAWMKG